MLHFHGRVSRPFALWIFLILGPAGQSQPVSSLRELLSIPNDIVNFAPVGPTRPVQLKAQIILLHFTSPGIILQSGAEAVYAYSPKAKLDGLRVGDWVHIEGEARAGGYAPIVMISSVKKLYASPLPEPVPISASQLFEDEFENRRIRIRGVLRRFLPPRESAGIRYHPVEIELPGGSVVRRPQIIPGVLYDRPGLNPESLAGAMSEITAICGTSFNSRGQRRSALLYISNPDDVRVLSSRSQTPGPFLTPAANVMRHHSGHQLGDAIAIGGIVTMVLPDGNLWVQDASGGMIVELAVPVRFAVGDSVNAVGMLALDEDGDGVSLGAAMVRAGPPRPAIQPFPVRDSDPGLMNFSGRLIRIEAEVVNSFRGHDETEILLNVAGNDFYGILPLPGQVPWATPTPGDHVAITGILSTDNHAPGQHTKRLVLARSPEDFTILSKAPWWKRFPWLETATVLILITLGSLVWVHLLRTRVNQQTRELIDPGWLRRRPTAPRAVSWPT